MNKIELDKTNKDFEKCNRLRKFSKILYTNSSIPLPPFDVQYKYEFRHQTLYLESGSKDDHGLENWLGFGSDVRYNVFEHLAKDFLIELRQNIFKEDKEALISTNLDELIKNKAIKPIDFSLLDEEPKKKRKFRLWKKRKKS